MSLYLVRHGEAVVESQDPDRPLTSRGRGEVERVARHVAGIGPQLAEIRHSSKLRARQTAEILAVHLSPLRGILEMEGLAPGDSLERAEAEAEAAREPLMLVGHLPHLSRLTSLLLTGNPDREIVRFPSGAILCLDRTQGEWFLQWVLTPELARF